MVSRYKIYGNIRNTFTKGLGKMLMYIVACKAESLGYNVTFTANDYDNLKSYYNKSGFTRSNGSFYTTDPSTLQEKIQEANRNFKEIDEIEYFKPIWLKNEYGDIIQCPECMLTSGTSLSVSHRISCPNKNKEPDLSEKPVAGGGYINHRKTKKLKKRMTYRIRKLKK